MPFVATLLNPVAAALAARYRSDDGSDIPWVKIIGIVIALVWWAVGALIKAGKQAPRPQQTWMPEPIADDPPPPGVLPPVPPWAQLPAAARQPVPPPATGRKRAAGTSTDAAARPFAQAPVVATGASPRRPAALGTPAASVRRMMTPAGLRRNYVATTLFDRPPSDDGTGR